MKKILIMMVCLFILSGCTTSNKPNLIYSDGEFEGIGTGAGGEMKVSVTILDNQINQIEIVSNQETVSYLDEIKDKMIQDVISNNGTQEVDVVTGATPSSQGLLDAINDALNKSKEALNGQDNA